MTGTGLNRRNILMLAGGAALSNVVPASAQPAPPVIGFLSSASEAVFRTQSEALVRALKEAGFTVGQNVRIEYRWAENQYDRLPALASELVQKPVSVIIAAGGNISAIVAKAATSTIPIVFTGAADPVTIGLVASLSRPGGNITGVTIFTYELDAKRLELLRELVPAPGLTSVLLNTNNPNIDIQISSLEAAAKNMNREVAFFKAANAAEIETAFVTMVEARATALVVSADPFLTSQREQIVALAARHAMPAVYQWREFAVSGGLISYGPSITNGYTQAGLYAGRILKGEKPADLPVLRPSQLELTLNLKTAQTLGLTIPQSLLARADEVIE